MHTILKKDQSYHGPQQDVMARRPPLPTGSVLLCRIHGHVLEPTPAVPWRSDQRQSEVGGGGQQEVPSLGLLSEAAIRHGKAARHAHSQVQSGDVRGMSMIISLESEI